MSRVIVEEEKIQHVKKILSDLRECERQYNIPVSPEKTGLSLFQEWKRSGERRCLEQTDEQQKNVY